MGKQETLICTLSRSISNFTLSNYVNQSEIGKISSLKFPSKHAVCYYYVTYMAFKVWQRSFYNNLMMVLIILSVKFG